MILPPLEATSLMSHILSLHSYLMQAHYPTTWRCAPADGRPMDPNDPAAQGPRPPGGWEAMLRGLHGVVGFFSRVSFLVDENTHAVHFFISALLQMLDR